MMTVLDQDYAINMLERPYFNYKRYILGILTIFSWTYQISIEIKQVRALTLKHYISNVYNVCDIIQYTVNLCVVIYNLLPSD